MLGMGRVSDRERSRTGAATSSTAAFWVSDWEVWPRAHLLRRGAQEQRLEPRVMALLVELAAHAGEVVSRDELLERVWSDVTVSDDAVHSAVSKLRRALRSGDGRPAIETVPRSGYRLVAEIRRPVVNGANAEPPSETSTVNGGGGDSARDQGAAIDEGRRPSDADQVARHVPLLAWAVASCLLAGAAGVVVFGRGPIGSAPPSRPAMLQVRPVTSWTGIEVEPALAPGNTGDRVAFAWKGPDQTNWDIWVQLVGAGNALRLTTDPAVDYDPSWSPDAKRVAFFRYRDGRCEVFQVPALGGAEQKLADCTGGEDLSWSADGARLLWAERPADTEPFRIVELVLGSGERRTVTSPAPGSVGDRDPVVSPDGHILAFVRSPVLGVQDVHLLPLAGGPIRRLTTDDLKIHGLDWTPDGAHLVFSSNRAGLFSLWQVRASGGEPRWLGVSGRDLDEPSVGAGGRLIAFEQWNDDTNVYRLDLNGDTAAERAFGSSGWDWRPHVSADGRKVVFVSDRTSAPELWWAELGAPLSDRQLTEMGGPYIDRPRLSPGGDEVVFDARPGGNADVYAVDTRSREVRRITEHSAQDVAASWSRDGKHIYFGSNRSGAWQIWRVPAAGGRPVQVTKSGGFFALESVDARWLYISRRHESGIWRQPLSTAGPAEPVTAALVPLDRSHFAVTKHALWFIRRPEHDRPVLSRLILDTDAIEDLGVLGRIPYNSGLALGADGASAFFTRIDRLESDIVVLDRGDDVASPHYDNTYR